MAGAAVGGCLISAGRTGIRSAGTQAVPDSLRDVMLPSPCALWGLSRWELAFARAPQPSRVPIAFRNNSAPSSGSCRAGPTWCDRLRRQAVFGHQMAANCFERLTVLEAHDVIRAHRAFGVDGGLLRLGRRSDLAAQT